MSSFEMKNLIIPYLNPRSLALVQVHRAFGAGAGDGGLSGRRAGQGSDAQASPILIWTLPLKATACVWRIVLRLCIVALK